MISTFIGVRDVHPNYLRSAATLGAPRLQTMLLVVLPAALPMILSGLRQAIATSLIVLVAAELSGATNGVAHMMSLGYQLFKVDVMFIGLFILGILGFVADRLFVWLTNSCFPGISAPTDRSTTLTLKQPIADVVLRSGTILTFNSLNSRHSAIAIRGDRILSVGRTSDIDLLVGPQTRVMDLAGQTVVPGFNNSHAHMEREGLKRVRVSLEGARSVGEVVRRVGETARQTPEGKWIVTMPVGDPPFFFGGLDILEEKRMPTRQELDAVAPRHPVCIPGLFGNWGRPPGYTVLNTLALELNGIGRETQPRCTGVEIIRDPSGNPTGLIIEQNSRPTVEFDLLRAVPQFTFHNRLRSTELSMKLYNAVGTTSAYEGHGSAPEIISAYRSLWEQRKMTVRVCLTVSPTWANVTEAALAMRDFLSYARGRGLGDHWLRILASTLPMAATPCRNVGPCRPAQLGLVRICRAGQFQAGFS